MLLKSIVLPLVCFAAMFSAIGNLAAQTAPGKPEKRPSAMPADEAAEWPGWLGPNRDGKSPDKGLLKQWPAGGPKLVWKATDIGKGYSSVAVAKGTVYITGDVDKSVDDFAPSTWTATGSGR